MLVRAKQTGYIYHRRFRENEVFHLKPVKAKKDGKDVVLKPEDQFSDVWMVKVQEKNLASKDKEVLEHQEALDELQSSDDEVI